MARSKLNSKKASSSGMDMSEYFKQDALSDVTLKYSDQEMKCHKIILATRSEYFRKLCGPNSQFAEATQAVIELKDDDPTALEALLRHIYTFDYIDDQEKRKDDWMFHIHYSIVARKYGFTTESYGAITAFGKIVKTIEAPVLLCKVITTVARFEDLPTRAGLMVSDLMLSRLHTLLDLEEFRSYLHTNEGTLWKLMKQLEPVKLEPVRVNLYRCAEPGCRYMVRAEHLGGLLCSSHFTKPKLVFSCMVDDEEADTMVY